MSSEPRTVSVGAATRPTASAAAPRPRVSGRYVACLTLLVLAAVSLQFVARQLGMYFRKEAVPLKLALDRFDAASLAPDYELAAQQPARFSEDVLQTLGTREYLAAIYMNLNVPDGDTTRVVQATVTYYTGRPDQVPHTPDICMIASGGKLVAERNVKIRVPGVGAKDDLLPLRLLTFEMPGERGVLGGFGGSSGRRVTVAYVFRTNDIYCLARNEVRLAQSSPFDRFAYYAKIELTFGARTGDRRGASIDETAAGAERFLGRFLPALLRDHFRSLTEMGAAGSAREGA